MLTVIIAPEDQINMYEKYDMFVGSIFSTYNIALCKCNYDADNLQDMVPDLYDVIGDCDKWRAVIVAPDRRHTLNPYDYTEIPKKSAKEGQRSVERKREEAFFYIEKACQNPLLKLTSALSGCAYSKLLMKQEDFDDLVSGKTSVTAYLLRARLRDTNTKRVAYKLRAIGDAQLKYLTGDDKYDAVVEAIENRDCEALIQLLSEDSVTELIRIIGGEDPRYTDPDTVEEDLCNYKKSLLFSKLEKNFQLLDKKPEEVRCVALRTYDTESYFNKRRPKPSGQSVYSSFVQENLYYPSLRFFTYDILQEDDNRYEIEFLKFLTVMLIFSANDIPRGSVSGGYLYRLDCDFLDGEYAEICQGYINRLYATHNDIVKNLHELSQLRKQEIDDYAAEEAFETPVVVPVCIRKSRSRDGLMAECRVGLSKDCPQDEEQAWNSQYKSIKKKLVKYLREPCRAVKTAAKGPFKENNSVIDDRIRSLNEYQMEDIEYRLEEEELQMVETSTSHIFDVDEYNKKIDKAGKSITDRIAKRMTRRKTIVAGVIFAVIYFFGFIPLLISETNNLGTSTFSVIMVSLCMGLFLIGGMIALTVFRYQLRKRYRHFNDTMSGICQDIDNSLGSFSDYLSHACNVMRKYSILRYDKNPEKDSAAILVKHRTDIEKRIRQVADKYSQFIDTDRIDRDAEPYLNDYTVMEDYEYQPDYIDSGTMIEFINKTNRITVPVRYLSSIIAQKEDLYD